MPYIPQAGSVNSREITRNKYTVFLYIGITPLKVSEQRVKNDGAYAPPFCLHNLERNVAEQIRNLTNNRLEIKIAEQTGEVAQNSVH